MVHLNMKEQPLSITYIGGHYCLNSGTSTAHRTDLEAAGGEYTTGPVTLRKRPTR
jgi:hypothetical protein